MDSEWRRGDMTLLELLRKTSKEGAVHKALRRRFAALQRAAAPEVAEHSLEQWAGRAASRGE
eukprot:6284016-Alexandrium_andersonii.AAC.1